MYYTKLSTVLSEKKCEKVTWNPFYSVNNSQTLNRLRLCDRPNADGHDRSATADVTWYTNRGNLIESNKVIMSKVRSFCYGCKKTVLFYYLLYIWCQNGSTIGCMIKGKQVCQTNLIFRKILILFGFLLTKNQRVSTSICFTTTKREKLFWQNSNPKLQQYTLICPSYVLIFIMQVQDSLWGNQPRLSTDLRTAANSQ